jgi:hypothetical protein
MGRLQDAIIRLAQKARPDEGEVFLLEVNLVRYDRVKDARHPVMLRALRLGPEHRARWSAGVVQTLTELSDEIPDILFDQPPLREPK